MNLKSDVAGVAPSAPCPDRRAVLVEALEDRRLLAATPFAVKINFQAPGSSTPSGYLADAGRKFADRGNGYAYGWDFDNTANARDRNAANSPDQRYDTLNHMQKPGGPGRWAIKVPNGTYNVRLVAGDPSNVDSVYRINAEGVLAVDGTPTTSKRWFEGNVTVTVRDGDLGITNAGGAANNKLSFVEITAATPAGLPTIRWSDGATPTVPRAEASSAVVDGKLYVIGGWYDAPRDEILATPRMDRYDPAANRWEQMPDMPVSITHQGMAVDGQTIWLVGGYIGNHPGPGTTQVWKYDTVSRTWSTGPSLPEPRGAGASAIVGRWLHFFGGMNEQRTADQGTHWRLNLDNPAAGWQQLESMPNTRNHLTGIALGGKVYAIGGHYKQELDAVTQRSVHRFDPATGRWTEVAPTPTPRSQTQAATVVWNNRIVLFGGAVDAQVSTRQVTAYDPARNVWEQMTPLPEARRAVVGAFINGKFIVTTGNDPYPSVDTWIGTLV